MRKAIATLPNELFRSVTWDQGNRDASTTPASPSTPGIPIYFCDPRSPWQRGSNENTNGLLRQYMPKGTDLSQHSAADDLETHPAQPQRQTRNTLGFMTPSEKLAEFVALTG